MSLAASKHCTHATAFQYSKNAGTHETCLPSTCYLAIPDLTGEMNMSKQECSAWSVMEERQKLYR